MSEKRGRGNIFSGSKEGLARLEEMFEMRRSGMTYKQIGDYFSVNHTTIVHHCLLNNVMPDNPIQKKNREKGKFKRKVKEVQVPAPHRYAYILEEKINVGKKCYQAYVDEAERRGEKMFVIKSDILSEE